MENKVNFRDKLSAELYGGFANELDNKFNTKINSKLQAEITDYITLPLHNEMWFELDTELYDELRILSQ